MSGRSRVRAARRRSARLLASLPGADRLPWHDDDRDGWGPSHRRAWALLNGSTAPWWLAMVLAPRSRPTAWLVDHVTPAHVALGTTYVALLGRSVADGGGPRMDPADPATVAAGLQRPDGFLAAWAHYLTFDLVVGVWIHRTALEEGIDARLALLLTWWAGPAGLTLFTWQRRRARRRGADGRGGVQVAGPGAEPGAAPPRG